MRRQLDRIEAAVALAEAQTGGSPTSAIPIAGARRRTKAREWTGKDEAFLRENLGFMPEGEIARVLRRSVTAVRVHWKREMALTAPSKDPRFMSMEQSASGLGVDGKSLAELWRRGIFPARQLASTGRRMRITDRHVLMRWILDPMNWCYFDPSRVGAYRRRGRRSYSLYYDDTFWLGARMAVSAAVRKWDDRWLTTRQAAKALGMGPEGYKNINAAVRRGTLKGLRYQNWKILRSSLPRTGAINALGKVVPLILPQGQSGKENLRLYWAEVRAGRRPWPSRPNKAPQKRRILSAVRGGDDRQGRGRSRRRLAQHGLPLVAQRTPAARLHMRDRRKA